MGEPERQRQLPVRQQEWQLELQLDRQRLQRQLAVARSRATTFVPRLWRGFLLPRLFVFANHRPFCLFRIDNRR